MTNRFNMAEHEHHVGDYFGINNYVEETRKVDEERVLDQSMNDDLLPGTYTKDQVRQKNRIIYITDSRLLDLFLIYYVYSLSKEVSN